MLEKTMSKLPISVGILSWNAPQTLVETLTSYFEREFLHNVNDVCILFNEVSEEDKKVAEHFGIPYIGKETNIGIGKGFKELTSPEEVDNHLNSSEGTKLVVINSVCGCAARNARPAAKMAVDN